MLGALDRIAQVVGAGDSSEMPPRCVSAAEIHRKHQRRFAQ